mgnify:CR=1 FL=1
MSERIRKAKRRYTVTTMSVMLAYLAIVFIASQLEDHVTGTAALTALALAPVIPMAAACVFYLRVHRQMDEREQRINANAAGAALIVGLLTATAGGFLQSFGVIALEDPMLWFGSLLILAWGFARIAMGGFD